VLHGIAGLDVPEHVGVETIVVDNGGGDRAVATAVGAVRRRAPGHDVQLIVEPRQGVTHARRRGIAAARGELVAFVDDDCLLAEDWLRQALSFAAAHPRAGVIGGRNELRWEHEPSSLVLAYGESLARQNWGDEPFRVVADETRCPCGAGVVLRREAVLESGWLTNGRLVGRHARRPGAGEDTEVALMVRDAGWEVWYAPALRLHHFVAAGRTSLRHLLWLHYGFGRAEIYLRLLGRGLPLDRRHRWLGVRWALAELPRVFGRFWMGFLRYEDERPTWLIRLAWALGCLNGAGALLVRGRVDRSGAWAPARAPATSRKHGRTGPALRARAQRTAARRG
jgi:glycosyltransferase involved in cell wall biosynthesis